MRFTALDGTEKDIPIWAMGPLHQTVWCGSHVVKVPPKGTPVEIVYEAPALPPAMPRAAVQAAQEIAKRAWLYERATSDYLSRVNPPPLPAVITPVTDAELAAAHFVLDADREYIAAVREITELQSKRAPIGAARFLELLRKDHPPCGDE